MEKRADLKSKKLEVLLWSIALPGFGQLLNRKYMKGFVLIGLEFLVNVMGNFNTIIVLSFNMKIEEAIAQTNYLWLMFYPCLYFLLYGMLIKMPEVVRNPLLTSPCIFSLFCNSRLNFFSYIYNIWCVHWSNVAAYFISANWIKCWGSDSKSFG